MGGLIYYLCARGDLYREAMAYIYQSSSDGNICVSSDNDSRNRLLTLFYSPLQAPNKQITYLALNEQAEADWMICHSQD